MNCTLCGFYVSKIYSKSTGKVCLLSFKLHFFIQSMICHTSKKLFQIPNDLFEYIQPLLVIIIIKNINFISYNNEGSSLISSLHCLETIFILNVQISNASDANYSLPKHQRKEFLI